MLAYIVRRILLMIPVLVLISMFVFILIQLPPGDYLDTLVIQLESQGQTVAGAELASLKARYGLDRPMYVQYIKWVSGFPSGNFGASFTFQGRNSWDIIRSYLGFTVLIALSTQLFILLVGIPIGAFSAVRQYSVEDHVVTFVGYLGLSIPNFLLALILMFLGFSVFKTPTLGGLFSSQYIDAPWSIGKFMDLMSHLWIPIVVLGTSGTASVIRKMRANLLDVLNMQYVLFSRSKGLRERVVIFKHALRNAMHPIIMDIGMRLPALLSGSTVVSIVLSLPTLGPVLFTALTTQDMYMAGTILLFQCTLLLVGNLVADIMLAWLDPRIQYN